MANEELKPKLPIYDKDGRVRDERTAYEMAKTEMFARHTQERGIRLVRADEPGIETPEDSAEEKGKEFYLKYGVEVPQEDVPQDIRDGLTKAMKKYVSEVLLKKTPGATPSEIAAKMEAEIAGYKEFRLDKNERGEPRYILLFNFSESGNMWLCESLEPTDKKDEYKVDGHVFYESAIVSGSRER